MGSRIPLDSTSTVQQIPALFPHSVSSRGDSRDLMEKGFPFGFIEFESLQISNAIAVHPSDPESCLAAIRARLLTEGSLPARFAGSGGLRLLRVRVSPIP